MWMLVIVLLNTVPGIPTVTVLETYPTSQECQSEQARVGDEMTKAYPDDHDFEIACRLNPRAAIVNRNFRVRAEWTYTNVSDWIRERRGIRTTRYYWQIVA